MHRDSNKVSELGHYAARHCDHETVTVNVTGQAVTAGVRTFPT